MSSVLLLALFCSSKLVFALKPTKDFLADLLRILPSMLVLSLFLILHFLIYVLDSNFLSLTLYLVVFEGRLLDMCLCGLFIFTESNQGAPKPFGAPNSCRSTDLSWIQRHSTLYKQRSHIY